MAYHIYTTEAIICGSFDQGQSDRTYLLFTAALGMVFATARSVREERSRQRYALQPFSEVTVSLIHGKSGWRIGSVVPGINYYQSAPSRDARIGLTNLIKVVRQYVRGEQAEPALYKELQLGCQSIIRAHALPVDQQVIIITTRLLEHLGYVAVPPHLVPVVRETAEVATLPSTAFTELALLIKQASTASHLS
jgi:recombinational DNA repair protein (RecF pathway)